MHSVVRAIGGHGIGPGVSRGSLRQLCVRARDRDAHGAGNGPSPSEPMVNMGNSTGSTRIPRNGWTIYTQDGKPSAQWEIQVLVTEKGAEVLCW